MKSNFD